MANLKQEYRCRCTDAVSGNCGSLGGGRVEAGKDSDRIYERRVTATVECQPGPETLQKESRRIGSSQTQHMSVKATVMEDAQLIKADAESGGG